MGAARVRMSISMAPDDRALIESAATTAGISASAWVAQTAREEARWAVAQRIGDEIAAEAGVTDGDLAWAERVLLEEKRWALARKIITELSAEASLTDEDRAWAASVLGADARE